ncbi:MAG TPA: cell division protein FtsK [Roseburia sp.]|nr:cell division protein FtsK [Roseburia sp.]
MATGNRKRSTTGKKSSSGRKTNSGHKRNTKKQQEREAEFTREVVLWIVVAVSLLLFISNFGFGGTIGGTVSRFFFGLFGIISYIFPIVLLVGTFFAVSNQGNRVAAVKLVAVILFVAFLCMFFELISDGSDAKTAMDAYRYSFDAKSGGGLIGGGLSHMLCSGFGVIGAYVIDVIVLIISLVLITERSAFRGMQKGGRKVYESAKISNERHRERVEMRREEREQREQQRRMDRKVEGVAIDTKLIPDTPQKRSQDISEILPEDMIDLPEIKEEKHVTLTAGNMSSNATPSAFSDEALEAMGQALTEKTELFAAEEESFVTPGRPDPAMAFGMEPVPEETPYEEGPDSIPLFGADLEPEPLPEEPDEEVITVNHDNVEQPKTIKHQAVAPEPVHAKEADNNIPEEMDIEITSPEKKYIFPPVTLLKQSESKQGDTRKQLQETAMKLQQTLKNFGVNVTITNISCGPAVTRYELQPEMGVKVSKIVNLADDIKLNLAAADIRIEAPIPGKAAIGIEVPNKENVMVSFRELVESEEFQNHPSKISFCVGKDIGGKVSVADIEKMPHLLIAGATGSGKSVCINTIIMSILYKADPKDVKLIMVDPKVVELSVYNGIPHLLIPVVTDPKKAAGALNWAVAEMTDRYNKFAEAHVRNLKGYNAKIDSLPDVEGDPKPEKMPQIVIIVDELADLMMVAPSDVEGAICRLAQLARAAGIHLIIATQRPSVNVITGLIKANMPSRIAFAVTSGVDSRTILDMNGAEKLLGKGDMLFYPQGIPKPVRVQGAFVSDKEVSDVVNYIKEENGQVFYNAAVEEHMNNIESENTTPGIDSNSGTGDGRDAYFADAAKLLIDKEKGSIGMLQRYFKVGFNRAARIMDQLEEAGIVGPEEGTKPRRVLMTQEQFEQYEEEYL